MPYKRPEDNAAAVRKWQKQKVAAGCCMICGKSRGESSAYLCEKHRKHTNGYRRATAAKRIAAGRCAECNKQNTDKCRLCGICRSKKQGLENARRLKERFAMTWRLWLDDEAFSETAIDRHPPSDGNEWMVATSSAEAIALIEKYGVPAFIDFDHDLGRKMDCDDTAKVVCKYLTEHHFDADIEFRIHSANPDGTKWIRSYMDSWKRSKERQ